MKKKTKERLPKPNAFLYEVALTGFNIYSRFAYRIKILRNDTKNMEAPFVVLCNHPSNRDIVGAALTVYPHRVNAVGGNFLFVFKPFAWVLRKLGAIAKSQFFPDITAVKQMIYCARNKRVLLMFPEGQISPAGEQNQLPPGLGKLLRTMGVPVVLNLLHGAYLSTPKWAEVKRRRYIESECRLILTEEQVKSMTAEEIEAVVKKEMAYNDYDWQRKRRILYPCKAPAKGLEKLCYKCPKCGAEFTMTTDKREITCSACGNTGVMNDYGFLKGKTDEDVIPETPLAWRAYQREELAKEIAQDDFVMTQNCTLRFATNQGEKKEVAGRGVVSIDKNGILYQGGFFGEENFRLEGKAAATIGLPFTMGKSYEIPHDAKLYEITPDQPATVMKWVEAMDLIHHLATDRKDV